MKTIRAAVYAFAGINAITAIANANRTVVNRFGTFHGDPGLPLVVVISLSARQHFDPKRR
jgi:hypothetical protein